MKLSRDEALLLLDNQLNFVYELLDKESDTNTIRLNLNVFLKLLSGCRDWKSEDSVKYYDEFLINLRNFFDINKEDHDDFINSKDSSSSDDNDLDDNDLDDNDLDDNDLDDYQVQVNEIRQLSENTPSGLDSLGFDNNVDSHNNNNNDDSIFSKKKR